MLVFNYLHRPLFPALVRALKPGGILLCETYTTEQAKRGRPTSPDHLLEPGELPRLVAPLEVLRQREGEIDGRSLASVAARKPLSRPLAHHRGEPEAGRGQRRRRAAEPEAPGQEGGPAFEGGGEENAGGEEEVEADEPARARRGGARAERRPRGPGRTAGRRAPPTAGTGRSAGRRARRRRAAWRGSRAPRRAAAAPTSPRATSPAQAARKSAFERKEATGQKRASLRGSAPVASHSAPRRTPVQPKSAMPP